ncbi:hypothetical protein BDP27DRAFT_1368800 [Rhodocollybia butyracea]|uniref:Uncharacterized protein n=1 Tax=Rhodocollybia butyracea TaxID=206335 RepID=A0A9P5PBE2_9AGAR|nr:hypothetical protein BDP27DRAFT_1368800 [Rhodocollybia butyracea]
MFTANQTTEAPEWRVMVEAFELGQSEENPFSMPHLGVTVLDVQLEFAAEEKAKAQADQDANVQDQVDIGQVIPAQYIFIMLEVKDQQCQLCSEIAKIQKPLKTQLASFTHHHTRLKQQINWIHSLQHHHCPAAIQSLATEVPTVDTNGQPLPAPEAEELTLMFLSEMSEDICPGTLAKIEQCYCDAQCSTSLDELCHRLLVKQQLYTYKTVNARKQKTSM